MKSEEHRIQQACVNWFRYQYPKLSRLLFAIPNGGYRHGRTGVIMKAEGVVRGVPDLMLAVVTYADDGDIFIECPGLFIEMKSATGSLSPDQKQMIELLQSQGYRVEVCRSLDDFMKIVNDYLNK